MKVAYQIWNMHSDKFEPGLIFSSQKKATEEARKNSHMYWNVYISKINLETGKQDHRFKQIKETDMDDDD